jgi:hypothetical protein
MYTLDRGVKRALLGFIAPFCHTEANVQRGSRVLRGQRLARIYKDLLVFEPERVVINA